MPDPDDPRMEGRVSTKEAAAMLGITPNRAWRLTRNGALDSVVVGVGRHQRCLITLDSVEAHRQERARTSWVRGTPQRSATPSAPRSLPRRASPQRLEVIPREVLLAWGAKHSVYVPQTGPVESETAQLYLDLTWVRRQQALRRKGLA